MVYSILVFQVDIREAYVKEEIMGFVIGVLVIVVLVLLIMRMT